MTDTRIAGRLLVPIFLSLCLAACGDSDGPRYPKLEVADPVVEGPVEGNPLLLGTLFNLADVGYQQSEYFFSGTAHAYRNDNQFDEDGRWRVKRGESAGYKSRLVVYRPGDPA